MRTPAQIGGHPIHPMLVTIPIGLWVFSLVCDFIARGSATPQNWATASLYAMVGGVIGALLAALPGLIDLLSLRDKAIRKTALIHMSLNLTIVVLYAINAWTRVQQSVSPGTSLGLSVLAIAMLLVSGWLGGKMVYEAGVAVHTEELATGTTPERAAAAAAANRSNAGYGTNLRGERAMASDSMRPTRQGDVLRDERPSAGESEGSERR